MVRARISLPRQGDLAMDAYAPITARWIGSLVMLLFLVGCGGGGGGGGGGAPGFQYLGNTNAAEISATNASRLVTTVLGIDNTANTANTPGPVGGLQTMGGGSAQGKSGELTHLTRRLNRAFLDTLARSARTRSGSRAVSGVVPIDRTEACDSGSVSFRGE